MKCEKYDQILRNMEKEPHEDLKQFLTQHSNLLDYISKHTGKVSIYSKLPLICEYRNIAEGGYSQQTRKLIQRVNN